MISPTVCPDGSNVRVLAYTLGEEDFDDVNGNGHFERGEFDPDKDDKGEAFLDLNDDDVLNGLESFFVDWNNSGAREEKTGLKSDPSSPAHYNGTACVADKGDPAPTLGIDCSNELIYVYDVADPTQ